MQILHFNACRDCFPGLRKQLLYEYMAAKKIDFLNWNILVLHIGTPQYFFERQVPKLFRTLFMRKLYAWIVLLKIQHDYDIILMRHMTFDPFVLLFGWFIKNRITIHHSKEIEELKQIKRNWKGKFASFLERITGFANSRQVIGILGVTNEIAQFEVEHYKAKCPSMCYPNGIEVDDINVLEDCRETQNIHIAFMCGTFTSWHGLDRLIDSAGKLNTRDINFQIYIHLIGRLAQEQKQLIEQTDLDNIYFLCHGYMNVEDYTRILKKCDCGLGTLAIDRKKLSEGSMLKVREYLSYGIPVYSDCMDTSLPNDFIYYRKGNVDCQEIVSFAQEMKHVSRFEVRKASEEYIKLDNILKDVYIWLKESVLPIRR